MHKVEAIKKVTVSARPMNLVRTAWCVSALGLGMLLLCVYGNQGKSNTSGHIVRMKKLHSFVADGRYENLSEDSWPEEYLRLHSPARFVFEGRGPGETRVLALREDGARAVVLDVGEASTSCYYVAFENGYVCGPLKWSDVECLIHGKPFPPPR